MFNTFEKTIMFIALSPVLFACVILDLYTMAIAYPLLTAIIFISNRITGRDTKPQMELFAITKAVLNK